MLDEVLREQGRDCINNGKRLGYGIRDKTKSIEQYLNAVGLYLQIVHKTANDQTQIQTAYLGLAIGSFNSFKYQEAAYYYTEVIKSILSTEPDDVLFRNLTQNYIDLADAFAELNNPGAANAAIANAIKAFRYIQCKTDKELAIGDPVNNFLGFHSYFECQTSSDDYRKKSAFIKRQNMMAKEQIESCLENLFDTMVVGTPSFQTDFSGYFQNQSQAGGSSSALVNNSIFASSASGSGLSYASPDSDNIMDCN